MVRGDTVILLELWAAPSSLPVGVGCLYRKSLPRSSPHPLPSRLESLHTVQVLFQCFIWVGFALSAGGKCLTVLHSIS